MISRVLLTARTVAQLSPRQVAWRLRRVIRRLVGEERPHVPSVVPRLQPQVLGLRPLLEERLRWPETASVRRRAEVLRDGWVQAVGEIVPVDEVVWNERIRSHLFSYHLHYFDDAPGLAHLASAGDAAARSRLLRLWTSWLDTSYDGARDGWDPYPVSCRIPNWIRALVLLADRDWSNGKEAIPTLLRDRLLTSLWSQADRLARTVEWDVGGNHLIRNLTALVWASLALDPSPVDVEQALASLRGAFRDQTLEDGMHVERTPSYHAQVLHELLQCLELLDATRWGSDPVLEKIARSMREAFLRFVRQDGSLHPLGDTVPWADPPAAVLIRMASEVLDSTERGLDRAQRGTHPTDPTDPLWHLPAAGFAGYHDEQVDLVFDCGPFGARHQPGHGHCDGLSFVLSLHGTPVIVDPGVAGYTDDPDRFWARSTEAHNTIQIDGLEQTEIWDSFRAARRAVPGPSWVDREDRRLHGSIRPYHARHCVHERDLVIRAGEVRVADLVSGCDGRRVDTRLHLAPGADVSRLDDRTWKVRVDSAVLAIEISGVDGASWTEGLVFPGWGRRVQAPVLHGWIDCAAENEVRLGFRLRYGVRR